jgi:NAD(P)-dependent dehydrogenase (short-subunit alcohol dehydrogenase family)
VKFQRKKEVNLFKFILVLDEKQAETCYNCAAKFTKLHHFYDRMCEACAELNWLKRNQTVDMKGKIAIVTGARVKIGFEIALILLRCNASVVVTTRFPKDCALRFSKENDFMDWKDKLHIYGLDMRHIPSVIEFTEFVKEKYPRLDIIINNAAQTIRRPPVFYKHLIPNEVKSLKDFKPEIQKLLPMDYTMLQSSLKQIEAPKINKETSKELLELSKKPDIHLSVVLSQIPVADEDFEFDPKMFPNGGLDVNGQQIDLRDNNTWNYELSDVSLTEFMEVQTINSTAPFILNSQLKELMAKDQTVDKWIVNVSAMEGQFYRLNKTTKHPHTNMAKAALNMMTRTCGADYARDKIYMNSVDTGYERFLINFSQLGNR